MQKPEINIKNVPQGPGERDFIRAEAARLGKSITGKGRLDRGCLEKTACKILKKVKLDKEYPGFAMVAVNNEFWRERYSFIPYKRRLLLLPQCLRNRKKCLGKIDKTGALLCAECGSCDISEIKKKSRKLGYDLLIAEGSPVVLEKILNNDVDAVFGVACMDSLEKVFPRANSLGIPNIAVPLLCDGCVNTEMDMKEFNKWFLAGEGKSSVSRKYSLLPLARTAYSIFEEKELKKLIPLIRTGTERKKEVSDLAFEWIKKDGKRLRTIFTLAAYAALKYGLKAFKEENAIVKKIPENVRKTALAVEVLHKASLVHDDIEDGDTVRYEERTMNAKYGVPIALNTGDYLVGLGYKMISSEKKTLGADAVSDILNKISETYLKMSDGQGKELLNRENNLCRVNLKEVIGIYKLKTSSAFEIALYSGMRAAVKNIGDHGLVAKYSENLGIAFQIKDDISEWDGTKRESINFKMALKTPGIINALACRKGLGKSVKKTACSGGSEKAGLGKIRILYGKKGVFDEAEKMALKYKAKALFCAGRVKNKALREALELLAGLTFKD